MVERTVAIVAAHFPPSNLAGVHRARLLSQHLREFGWRPMIVTAHWDHYEEALDTGLSSLVDPALDIVRTGAFPVKPVRLIGDLGIRALPWHLSALRKMRHRGDFDFLLVTVPSFYSALLGELMYKQSPLPFGIDYIDPWVHLWPPAEIRYSKAWISMKLAERLEPWAVKHASLITGVAEGYYSAVLDRNPALRERAATAAMPYGFSNLDFAAPQLETMKPAIFDPGDGNLHLVYAGALLPKASGVLESLLAGFRLFQNCGGDLARRVRLHFIGTGKSPNDRSGYNILPLAARLGLEASVTEHPHRMSYLDVLVHLKNAAGILILGSTEPHYTPSKVYQAVQSRRPVLAFLHEASTAVPVLEQSRAGAAITLTEENLPTPGRVADALLAFLQTPYDPDQVDWSWFAGYSAHESARIMAGALDEAMERWQRSNRGTLTTVYPGGRGAG